jgi:hypothetical protein
MNHDQYPHNELLQVNRAYYVSNFIIEIEFNNGEVQLIDFESVIFGVHKKVYQRLQNLEYFQSFKIDYTIYWPDLNDNKSEEIAFTPEYLYFLAYQYDCNKHTLFKSWGYM